MKNTNKLITLLTQKEFKELRSNFDVNNERSTQGENVKAFEPVVKFFNPTGSGTWYLTELAPDNMGFGICQLHEIELGYVSLNALNELRLPLGLSIEKDISFSAKGQTIYQLLESLQSGKNTPNEKQITLSNTQKQDRIEKKATSIVENHVFVEQNHLVITCLENGTFDYDTVSNITSYYDQKGNKISGDALEEAQESDDFHDLYHEEHAEIYTWYLITDWLADKLTAKGEPILNTEHGTWWGRTTFGQLIVSDEVMHEIAEECL